MLPCLLKNKKPKGYFQSIELENDRNKRTVLEHDTVLIQSLILYDYLDPSKII